MKIVAVLVLAVLAITTPLMAAQEYPTVADFFTMASRNNVLQDKVYTAGEAFGLASRINEENGQQPLYCQPEGLNLTVEQYIKIAETYLEAEPVQKIFPSYGWPLMLLYGLQKAFPCK